ncbi:MAG TPA: dTMP kinase [Thermoplasmata archaeon]|nr:dTMP kinase [Thermoplasmata archaeon]
MTRRGLLVALEGIDGAGKSTLTRSLARRLRARGYSVARWREPTDPRIGRLAQSVGAADPWTGAVYFTVDRHLARPRLESLLRRHDVVLSDRSFFSTLAYQGSALPPRERRRLAALERSATVAPDRVLLVDLPPELALRRLGGRGRGRGPLERRAVLARVARAYRGLARAPGWTVLDARRPRRELTHAAVAALRLPDGAARRHPSGRT